MKRLLTLLLALVLAICMTGYAEQTSDDIAENTEAQNLPMNVWSKDVKALQKKLKELGYNCGYADGVMGEKTKAAVMELQAAMGWEATGEVRVADLQTIMSLTREDLQSAGKIDQLDAESGIDAENTNMTIPDEQHKESINMVLDGNFQNGMQYWGNWGKPTVCEIVEIDGKNWMHLVSSGSKYEGLRQTVLNRSGNVEKPEIIAGMTYELSFKAFAPKGSEGKEFTCGIHNYALDDKETKQEQYWTPKFSFTNDVQTYTMQFTSHYDGTFCIMIGVGGPGLDEIIDAYYTDVVIKPCHEEEKQ